MPLTPLDLAIPICLLGLVIGLYLMPALIGRQRDVTNSGTLLFLNLLFGWTVLGWIVLLIWAVAGQTKAADAYYRRVSGSHPP